MQEKHKPKMLMALSPENIPIATRLFESEYALTVSTSMDHAKAMLNERFDVIAATACFDESSMFDLLRYCKADPVLGSLPFIAMRLKGSELDNTAHQAIHIASQALGAEGFVDLNRLERINGHRNSEAEFLNRIRMLLEKRMPD
jgi:hypothetical protein